MDSYKGFRKRTMKNDRNQRYDGGLKERPLPRACQAAWPQCLAGRRLVLEKDVLRSFFADKANGNRK